MTNPELLNDPHTLPNNVFDGEEFTRNITLGNKHTPLNQDNREEVGDRLSQGRIQVMAACSAVSGAILGFMLSGLFTLAIAVFLSSLVSFAVGWKAGLFGSDEVK